MIYEYWVIAGLWLLWAAYWMLSAQSTKQSEQSESGSSRLIHLGLVVAAFALVALPGLGIGFLGWRLLPDPFIAFLIGVAVEALGLGFAVWARIHLGQYWSGTIEIKSEHQLIRSGPYALVRHPIYTGFVLAFLGTALAANEFIGLLALMLIIVAYSRKIWMEEKWLVHQFGEEYTTYQREVNALVPFLW
ncbi:MAG: isoprenylcysteine carboxylmethyltransferase family protein [Ktedonobacteraceae bacterium]|nr:isoprenylcysteine carboxylmethyltransferase family protein [Ktedonobacteraceae bacterium]